MGGENHDPISGDLVQFLHEDRAFGFKCANNLKVMYDRAPDVDWRAVFRECGADSFDRSDNAGTETPRSRKQHLNAADRRRFFGLGGGDGVKGTQL